MTMLRRYPTTIAYLALASLLVILNALGLAIGAGIVTIVLAVLLRMAFSAIHDLRRVQRRDRRQ